MAIVVGGILIDYVVNIAAGKAPAFVNQLPSWLLLTVGLVAAAALFFSTDESRKARSLRLVTSRWMRLKVVSRVLSILNG